MTERALCECVSVPFVEHVRQRHVRGCSVACLAMLLGVTYADAVLIGKPFHVTARGSSRSGLEHALAAHGYALRHLPHALAPFAPLHFGEVRHDTSKRGQWHTVVVDGHGLVFDPDLSDPYASLDDYLAASAATLRRIVGCYRVA